MNAIQKSRLGRLLTICLAVLLFSAELPAAHAVNYTVTYDANAGYVGAISNSVNGVIQAGVTTGSVPGPDSAAASSSYVVQAQGSLARQGFTFAGWSTAQNGNGTLYSAGNTFTINSNVTLYAKWIVPVSARLIGNGGTMVSVVDTNLVTNGSFCLSAGVRGITSDGTYIYFRPSTYLGYICKVTQAGVVVSVNAVSGLASVGADSLALVYGNGCLFLRKTTTTYDSIYCIALSNWSLNSITLPVSYPLPAGGTWLYGNFIQFPDGRIGSVSAPIAAASWTGPGTCPLAYCKKLRVYTVSGTGATVATTYSMDFVLADSESWPGDDHGIATDGTYLYQVMHQHGYKVWALQNTGVSYLVFNGDGAGTSYAASAGACGASTGISGSYCQITYPVDGLSTSSYSFGNATYFGRAHGLNKYLIGDYLSNSKFWLSDAASPPPGPGNPDIVAPAFTSTDTFTVAENITTTFNAAAIVVNESATLTITGALDGSQFNIVITDTATAYIRFNVSPDYEGPTDTGGNNQYDLTISATDSAGNTGTRTINIRVTNVNEVANIPPPSVSGNIYKGLSTSLTLTVNAPGKVRFFMDGKRIAGCLAISTTGSYPNYVATCSWKPTTMTRHNVTAQLTPSDVSFTGGISPVLTVWVLRRTTTR